MKIWKVTGLIFVFLGLVFFGSQFLGINKGNSAKDDSFEKYGQEFKG